MAKKEREKVKKRETGRELIRRRTFWLCTNKTFIVFPSFSCWEGEAKTYRIERERER